MTQPIKVQVLDHYNMSFFYKGLEDLKEYAFQVSTSLHKCFISLATEKPDLIVLPYIANVNDPEQDIITIAKTNKIPFIIMSREATQEKVVKSARDGAVDFLLSSVEKEDFLKRINMALAKIGKKPPQRDETDEFALDEDMTSIERILTVLEKAKELKAMPYTAAKVVSLCTNPSSSAADIARPIRSDAALSSSILKHSNSVIYYRGMPKVQTLPDAIVRIGLDETKETCLVHAVYHLFDKSNKTFGFDRHQFWIHSLGTGIIAKNLAEMVGFARVDAALLGGVLHDLGKMILDDYFNADYDKIIRRAATQRRILFNVENEAMDTTHSFIGGKVAENWRFPEIITYAIKHHHDYSRSFIDGGESINLATIIFVANLLAKSMCLGSSSDYYVTPIPHVVWEKMGFGETIPHEFMESVHRELHYYFSFLDVPREACNEQVPPDNKHMRILLLSNSAVANVYIRLYLANGGYSFVSGGPDNMPDGEFDLIIYDFFDELEPHEMEFMIKVASDHKQTSALFVHGGINDILVLQKMHREVKGLLLPLDMFAFDQIVRNFNPETGEFSDTIIDRASLAAAPENTSD